MKRVTLEGFNALAQDAKGGPELAPTDVCLQCLTGVAVQRAAAQAAHEEEHAMLARVDEHVGKRDGYYVASAWLQYVERYRAACSAHAVCTGRGSGRGWQPQTRRAQRRR